MLVLTVRLDEDIYIGDPLNPIAIIHCADIRSSSVRIGIIADPAIKVYRHDIAQDIIEKSVTALDAMVATERGNHHDHS